MYPNESMSLAVFWALWVISLWTLSLAFDGDVGHRDSGAHSKSTTFWMEKPSKSGAGLGIGLLWTPSIQSTPNLSFQSRGVLWSFCFAVYVH